MTYTVYGKFINLFRYLYKNECEIKVFTFKKGYA